MGLLHCVYVTKTALLLDVSMTVGDLSALSVVFSCLRIQLGCLARNLACTPKSIISSFRARVITLDNFFPHLTTLTRKPCLTPQSVRCHAVSYSCLTPFTVHVCIFWRAFVGASYVCTAPVMLAGTEAVLQHLSSSLNSPEYTRGFIIHGSAWRGVCGRHLYCCFLFFHLLLSA